METFGKVRPTSRSRQATAFFYLLRVLILGLAYSVPAEPAFVGDYAPGKFTLFNSNADGFAVLGAGGSLVFTGGNNGTGLPGFTDFTIAALSSGVVSFDWMYTSADEPGFDLAGYLTAGSVHFLADSPNGGSISFNIAANQVFGFRIGTEDNTHEPGVLTISNFIAPTATSVPEPSYISLCPLGFALAALLKRRVSGQRGTSRVQP